jgi:hypothetical protein
MVLEKLSSAVVDRASLRTTTVQPSVLAGAVTNGTCTSPPVSAADMRYCHSTYGA